MRRHLRIGPLRLPTSGPADFALIVANGAHLRCLLERFADAELTEVHELDGDGLVALLTWKDRPT